MYKKILVTGAGGFIGGHLVNDLLKKGYIVRCVDIKPLNRWFQIFPDCENLSLDLKIYKNCDIVTKDIDYIFNLACNMGGMGFIENNKAECMLSVLINTNLLLATKKKNIKNFFFSSSACVYNMFKQNSNFIDGLKEDDAYPAYPEDGYGWEKLFSERMCNHFHEDFGLTIRIARFHNVYGPFGTYDGGREKAPAALCRKIIKAKMEKTNEIEIWGDGNQTRSFMFIDDCITGINKILNSNCSEPLNLGSDEQISINQMIDILEEIAKVKVKRIYLLDKPLGVRGRSSDNTKIKKHTDWAPEVKIKNGLEKTYNWIFEDLMRSKNSKFTN